MSGEPAAPLGARRPTRIEIFTIFPEIVAAYLATSILGRAQREQLVELTARDLRSGAHDARRTVDDAPFGGGAGMVLSPGPVFAAVEAVGPPRPLLFCSPGGRRFDQHFAGELASLPGGFSLLCGRYEGVDQRVIEHLVDGEVSIGDFVLAGGELAALAIVEATVRLIPGALGNEASLDEESFTSGLLEYPHYTRPASFRDWDVPEVLRAGDHARVRDWRLAAALDRTIRQRPDLIVQRGGLSPAEARLLAAHGYRRDASELAGTMTPTPAADALPTEEPDQL